MPGSRIFANVDSASCCAALFPKSVDECKDLVGRIEARADTALSKVYEYAEKGECTYANTAEAIDLITTDLGVCGSLLAVIGSVSTDRELRDEASRQMALIKSFTIDRISSNKKVYEALKAVAASPAYQKDYLKGGSKDPEYAYWMSEQLEDYKRRGMELPEAEFQKVVALQKELSSLFIQFGQNISEDKTEVHLAAGEVKGIPENVLNPLKKTEDGKYILKMDYPTYFGVMENCEVASTREKMEKAFDSRAYPSNDVVLKEIITKRHQLAKLLGYPSFAHLNISDKMAKTPETAKAFMQDLIPGLQGKWKEECNLMKKHLHPSCALTEKGEIASSDVAFMMNQIKKTLLNVSETQLQEYFPMEVAMDGLIDIYQSFFDITFTKVNKASAQLWHSSVEALEIKENSSGNVLGYVILDLFPREGKFSHGCCHSAVPAVRIPQSETEFSPSVAVILANLTAPVADRPALFTHDDLVTLFHEFGHATHTLMGRTKMSTFAGTRVKLDFVEVPSQTLEEWLWEPEMLERITSHYKTGDTLPRALIEAKVASRNAFSARHTLRQLQFALFSLEAYNLPFSSQCSAALDMAGLFHSIKNEVMPDVHQTEGTNPQCSFGHMSGYAAGVYSYTWAKVFALDVFAYIREHNGLIDPKMGQRYVECIVGVGGSKDPNQILEKFLERPPNNEAYLRSIGV